MTARPGLKRRVEMVNISRKHPTVRTALARCRLAMMPRTLAAIKGGLVPKGDVWAAAQVAGILAAKRVGEMIPLCHPIPVSHVGLRASFNRGSLVIEAGVTTTASTGPEMEALAAVAIAGLTVYDMCKALDRGIVIERLYLVRKSGGKSGTWTRRGLACMVPDGLPS